jgi:hypothetical protein
MRTILAFQTFLSPMKNRIHCGGARPFATPTPVLLVFSVLVTWTASAQERELDLRRVFVPDHQVKAVQAARSGGDMLPPLGLPFVDDFAWPSLYEEDAPVYLKRWEASPVRRTTTLAYQPPTLGCATLDGLNALGNPYQLNPTNAAGYADTLTSRRLLLGSNNYSAGDSVALSFWYQSGGIANGADAGEDSLIVEFRTSVVNEDPWRWVWSTEGIDDDTVFHAAVIHISGAEYFHNDFQFRFRSYGSLEGNVDTWHLDYVRVAQDGMTPAPLFEEIAFVAPPTSMLRYPWTAMPWPHFVDSADQYTATTAKTLHRSFGESSNSQEDIGMKVQRVDVVGNVNNYAPAAGSIPNNSVQGLFETDYVADLQILTTLFNPALSDTFATFHVSMWEDEVGAANGTNQSGITDNDSLIHVQTFRDYYAYDDGTAEKAYALDGQGGELVVGFDLQKADTLDGVWIHFAPFFDDAAGETFTLKVRGEDEENPGQPGGEIETQYGIHQPNYFANAYDGFTYVEFDSPIAAEAGRVYIGFVQQGEDRINVGLDKSTNTNPEYLWYKFPSTPWQLSGIQGSLMIRPVLRAGKELVTNVSDLSVPAQAPSLFPNPGAGVCHWVLAEPTHVRVVDVAGRTVADLGRLNVGRHSWSTDTSGIYLLVGTDEFGQTWTQRWIARP